jgi:citrate lyase subunit beta/citryl-CoA lyase
MRALLPIQSYDDRALAEAAESGADGLILDFATGESDRVRAQRRAAKALLKLRQTARSLRLYARIARLADADADLDAIMPAWPDGILLAHTKTGADLQQLSVKLSVREAELGLADGATQILATAATSPASVFDLGALAGKTQRLAGMIFGGDDLARALGSPEAASIALARNLTLLAARATGVPAIDSAAPRDIDGAHLRELCAAAKRDGFDGKLAGDLTQLAIIHSVFKD